MRQGLRREAMDPAQRAACERMPYVINYTAVDEFERSNGTVGGAEVKELTGMGERRVVRADFWGVGLFVIDMVVGAAMLVAFVAMRRRYDHTRVRTVGVPLALFLALVAYVCTDQVVRVVGTRNLPCWSAALTMLAIVPFLGAGVMLLFASFFTSNLFSQAVAKYGRITDNQNSSSDELGSSANNNNDDNGGGAAVTAKEVLWTLRAIFRTLQLIFWTPITTDVTMTPEQRVESLRLLKFAMSWRGQLSFMSTFFVFMGIFNFPFVFAGEPAYANGCYGCFVSPFAILFSSLDGAFCTVLGVLIAYRSRKLRDPWGMRRDALLTVTWAMLGLCFFVASLSAPFDEFSLMLSLTFLACLGQNTVVPLVMGHRAAKQEWDRRNRPAGKSGGASQGGGAVSPSMVESTLEPHSSSDSVVSSSVATSGLVPSKAGAKNLTRLLANAATRQALRDWVTSELSSENLTFLEDSAAWVAAFNDVSPSARLARAKRLFKAYVEPGAIFQVNVDEKLVRSIAARVSAADSLTRDAFDEARVEAARMLEYGAVARFIQSGGEGKAIARVVSASPGPVGVGVGVAPRSGVSDGAVLSAVA